MDIHDLFAKLPCRCPRRSPRVSVVRLYGVIGQTGPLRQGLTLSALAATLERAFKPKHLAAVALAINSPGGSPVQSALIAGRIRALAEEKKVPVFAFIEDVGASGGYWLATAADEIFADEASIVGSIGVVSAGFGFHELLQRFGVERRLYTQGAHKAMLDPFGPAQPDDVTRLKALQADLHDGFKAVVRRRREGRLTGSDEDLFEGDIWTGRRAQALGLIDGIGDLRGVLRGRFGDQVRLRVVGEPRGWLRRRLGLAAPADWIQASLAAVEERSLWARYGL